MVALLVFFFFRDKPASVANRASLRDKEQSFWVSLREVAKNRNVIVLSFIYGFAISAVNTSATIVGEVVKYFNFTSSDASIFGITVVVGGVFGCVIVSIFVTRTKKFKLTIVFLLLMTTLVQSFATYGYYSGTFWMEILASFFFGFFSLPLIPIVFELGVEVSHPFDESYPSAVITSGELVMSIVMNPVCSALIKEHDREGALISFYIIVGMIALGFVSSLFIKEDLKRQQFEQERSFLVVDNGPEALGYVHKQSTINSD